jgi:hypothetical protein
MRDDSRNIAKALKRRSARENPISENAFLCNGLNADVRRQRLCLGLLSTTRSLLPAEFLLQGPSCHQAQDLLVRALTNHYGSTSEVPGRCRTILRTASTSTNASRTRKAYVTERCSPNMLCSSPLLISSSWPAFEIVGMSLSRQSPTSDRRMGKSVLHFLLRYSCRTDK